MYRHWIAGLFLSVLAVVACVVFAVLCDYGVYGRIFSLLPFQLTVTAYYVSMLVVRKRYQRSDEVRYRAHYIRGIFFLLFLVSWLFPLAALSVIYF